MVLKTRDGKCILCRLNLGESAFKELRDYLGIPKVLSFNSLLFLGGEGGGQSGLVWSGSNGAYCFYVNIP